MGDCGVLGSSWSQLPHWLLSGFRRSQRCLNWTLSWCGCRLAKDPTDKPQGPLWELLHSMRIRVPQVAYLVGLPVAAIKVS